MNGRPLVGPRWNRPLMRARWKPRRAHSCRQVSSRNLAVRRVVASARDAMDHEIVDLPMLGMEQNGITSRAGKIDGVSAGDQDGRGANDRTADRTPNRLQADLPML